MNNLSKAINLYLSGLMPIPLQERGKKPVIKWSWMIKRQPRPDEIEFMFRSHRGNIGIVAGPVSNNLVVLDFDTLEGAAKWLVGTGIKTYSVLSSRGIHAYMKVREAATSVHLENTKLDILSQGKYCLAAGSVHPTGSIYKVWDDSPIATVNRLEDVLFGDLLAEYKQAMAPARADFQYRPILHTVKPVFDDPWQSVNQVISSGDLLDTIKRRFPILDFFPDALPSGGNHWYITCCPLHDDHNPSFWIDTEKQLCGCYSGCNHGRPMDVIDLHAQLNGLSIQGAIAELRQRL